jgi:hypothetical protein
MTALHFAAYWGCKDVALVLIEHGSDLEAKDIVSDKTI